MDGFKSTTKAVVSSCHIGEYVSEKSGLTITVAKITSPVTRISIVVPTAATSDSGLPHCLEHLCFRGSRLYPSGFLDSAIQMVNGHYTNAYTESDRTVYYAELGGYPSDGSLKFIGAYLDHVFFPKLEDFDFSTEVWDVGADGYDSGVVFCEMDSHRNDEDCVIEYGVRKQIYPDSYSLKYNTAGAVDKIRTLTNDQVRAYHEKAYRPSFCQLIVVGNVEDTDVLKAVLDFENSWDEGYLCKIQKDIGKPNCWVEQPFPQFLPSSILCEFWPSDNEDEGHVTLSYRYPCGWSNLRNTILTDLWLMYLSEGAGAPFAERITECEDPWANDVESRNETYRFGFFNFTFKDVPTELMRDLPSHVNEIIEDLITGKEKLKLHRMQALALKQKHECLEALEDAPHDTLSENLAKRILNCSKAELEKLSIEDCLNPVKVFEEFQAAEDPNVFLDWLKTNMLESNCYVHLLFPSKTMGAEAQLEKKAMADLRQRSNSKEELPSSNNSSEKTARVKEACKNWAEHLPMNLELSKLLPLSYTHNSASNWEFGAAIKEAGLGLPYQFLNNFIGENGAYFQSNFSEVNFILRLKEKDASRTLWQFLNQKSDGGKLRIRNLDKDIVGFIKEMRTTDFEKEFLEKEKNKEEALPPKKQSEKEEGSEEGIDLEDYLCQSLVFILNNFSVATLLPLLSETLFNSDLYLPKKAAITLKAATNIKYEKLEDSNHLVRIPSGVLDDALTATAVSYGAAHCGGGSSAVFSDSVCITWKALEGSEFVSSLPLLRAVLLYTEFTDERFLSVIRKEVTAYSSALQEGDILLKAIQFLKKYDFNSPVVQTSFLPQNLLVRVAAKYPEIFAFIAQEIWRLLLDQFKEGAATCLQFVANPKTFVDQELPALLKVFPELKTKKQPSVLLPYKPLREFERKGKAETSIDPIVLISSTMESSSASIRMPLTTLPKEVVENPHLFHQNKIAHILVSEFLNSDWGWFFGRVRDAGFAYSASYSMGVSTLTHCLEVSSANDPAAAFSLCFENLKAGLKDLLKEEEVAVSIEMPSKEHFENLKRSAFCRLTKDIQTPADFSEAVLDDFLLNFKKSSVEASYAEITKVTYEEFLKLLKELIEQLLNFSKERSIVIVGPEKRALETAEVLCPLKYESYSVYEGCSVALVQAAPLKGAFSFLLESVKNVLAASTSDLIDESDDSESEDGDYDFTDDEGDESD